MTTPTKHNEIFIKVLIKCIEKSGDRFLLGKAKLLTSSHLRKSHQGRASTASASAIELQLRELVGEVMWEMATDITRFAHERKHSSESDKVERFRQFDRFIKTLFLCISKTGNSILLEQARLEIVICSRKNKIGTDKTPLIDAVATRLKPLVGESLWNQALVQSQIQVMMRARPGAVLLIQQSQSPSLMMMG
jgi:hypothetical protein